MPGTIVPVAVVAIPMFVVVLSATSTQWFFPNVIPQQFTFGPARRLLGDLATRAAMWEGLRVSGTVTAVAIALAWPAARVLCRAALRGRSVAVAVLFLPSILPSVGLAMGVDVALLRVGLAGGFTGVVIAHLVPVVPYAVAVLTAVFVRHDERTEAQAAVLGADKWQQFRLVTVPLMSGGVAVAAALAFVVSWSQYLLTVLAGSGRIITITVLLFAALSGGNPTTISVLAVITVAPVMALLALAGRRVLTAEST